MAGPLGPSPQSTYLDIPIFNALFPKEGPKSIPVTLNFANQQSFNVDLTLLQQRGFIKTIQSVWVDNSQNASALSIQVAGSNQTVKIPGNSQGCLPIFVPASAQFVISCAGGQNATIYFTNVPLPAAVWSATSGFSFTGAGYLQVSDVALDACVSGGNLNVSPNGTGNNNVSKPFFVADEMFTGSATTTTAQTIITGNPSFFITDLFVALTGNAAASAASTLTVTLKDGATTIAEGLAAVPASSGTTLGAVPLIALHNLQYNSKANANTLNLTLSENLTAGAVYWNVAGGLTTNIGP